MTHLKAKDYSNIALLMGASMGGMIGLYLVAKTWLHIQTVVLEGAPSMTSSRFIGKMVETAFLKKHRKAKKMTLEQVEQSMAKMYGEAFAPAMARNFRRMDESWIKQCS